MLDPIFTDYLAICETDLTSDTLAGYRSAFRAFSRYLDEEEISFAEITQPEVQGFIFHNAHLKASTLKHRIKSVRAAFNYARNCTRAVERYDDPFARLRYPVQPDSEPITYSDQEIRKLYEAIQTEREWLCFHLFAFAGLRRGEVCNLKWEDIDFKAKMLTVTAGKGNKLRRVPLHPELAAALAECRRDSGYVLPTESHSASNGKPAGTKLNPDSLHVSNARWYRRAEVAKAHNHCFRRTINSVMKEKGVSHEDREQIMGWAPKDVMGRYYTRFLDKTLHEAICRVNYGLDRKRTRHSGSNYPHLRLVEFSESAQDTGHSEGLGA
jgi:integrase